MYSRFVCLGVATTVLSKFLHTRACLPPDCVKSIYFGRESVPSHQTQRIKWLGHTEAPSHPHNPESPSPFLPLLSFLLPHSHHAKDPKTGAGQQR
ncbi:uncharacterized protein IWZ02DRAFT_189595 [Phyllosticta citriasiana]|uniref:uncharacterized protein n=1 Tax=Phyllosticta citriasiana TaxID=595635 RepID=UPI0030FD836B